MNRIKISDSDKRLLLIFCAIVIVACSYFFIFSKGMSKAAKIEEQNTADQAKVQQMEQMEAGLPKVKENIQLMVKKQKTIISTYPSAMTTEKAIESLQAYEDNSSDFHITDITFTMNQPLAVDVQTDGTDTAAGTDDSSTTAPDAEASSTSESQSEESTQGAMPGLCRCAPHVPARRSFSGHIRNLDELGLGQAPRETAEAELGEQQ